MLANDDDCHYGEYQKKEDMNDVDGDTNTTVEQLVLVDWSVVIGLEWLSWRILDGLT